MTRQKDVLNNSLTLLTTMTNSLTTSAISPIFYSLSSSPSISPTSTSPTTKLPKEPPPNKQTKKHHRKLSFLYKQVEHLELKLLFKRAFIERELLCKLESAKKIKDDASELELVSLIQLNQIRSRIIFLQNSETRHHRRNNHKNKNNFSSTSKKNKTSSSCSSFNKNKNDDSLSNISISNKKKDPNNSSFDDLSIDELTILLDQKEKEMNAAIQSSQNQIEELLKDAYDYLEEEEYLKLDIQDIKLEIEDLETMCI